MVDMLSPQAETQINQMISNLEKQNGTEIAIVTVPETKPSSTPKEFTTELFNSWGIGKKGKDNGILFLISKGDRRTEIETGYRIESILADAKVGNILRTQVTPQ
ncbi:MAG: TPM domain-containing protein [Cyanobacteria bacterium J06632_19]